MTINREAVIEKLKDLKEQGFEVPSEDMIKTNEEIEKFKESAKINTELLDLIAENIKPGMTTDELDKIAHEFLESKGAKSEHLNFKLDEHIYPKSISTSVNNEIYFGIPSSNRVLKDGDIVNVCSNISYNGYFSDSSRMFMVGNVSDEAKRLVEVAKECLHKGIESIKPWGHIGDIVHAVEEHAKVNGYSVFDGMGHGLSRIAPEEPFFGPNKGQGMVLAPGMVISLAPVINQGKKDWYIDKDNGFTMYTKDGKLSAQWEQSMIVTENGVEILAK